MASYYSDIRSIRAVGLVITGLGIILTLLTLTTVLLSVLNVPATSGAFTTTGALQVILAIGMSLTMVGCGTRIAQAHNESGIESLRLNWAALFGTMIITWLGGFWLRPELGGLSLLILVLLLGIRAQIIRIS